MANLNDIINLAKADGGKFFVMDEQGEAKLVIMSLEDYQKLLLGKLKRQVEDVEKINQMILRAQITEEEIGSLEKLNQAEILEQKSGQNDGTNFEVAMTKSEKQLFQVMAPEPPKRQPAPSIDLRAEVIDPSFDFEGPKMEFNDF